MTNKEIKTKTKAVAKAKTKTKKKTKKRQRKDRDRDRGKGKGKGGDKKNIAIIAKAARHKLPGESSLNVSFVYLKFALSVLCLSSVCPLSVLCLSCP